MTVADELQARLEGILDQVLSNTTTEEGEVGGFEGNLATAATEMLSRPEFNFDPEIKELIMEI